MRLAFEAIFDIGFPLFEEPIHIFNFCLRNPIAKYACLGLDMIMNVTLFQGKCLHYWVVWQTGGQAILVVILNSLMFMFFPIILLPLNDFTWLESCIKYQCCVEKHTDEKMRRLEWNHKIFFIII